MQGAFAVFLGYFLLHFINQKAIKEKLDDEQRWSLTKKVAVVGALAGVAVMAALWPTGYFGPLSSRIRGLFVQHTRTGNPLVDSVAEHQPTSPKAYWQFLNIFCYFAPLGTIGEMMYGPTQASTFLIAYAFVAYYFCSKVSACGGGGAFACSFFWGSRMLALPFTLSLTRPILLTHSHTYTLTCSTTHFGSLTSSRSLAVRR
jgi:hypothetical protein